jgi:hypothetical protein
MLRGFRRQGVLIRSVSSVAAKDPPTKPSHAKGGHEKGDAHEEPGGNPFADEKRHPAIIGLLDGRETFGVIRPVTVL